MSNLDDLESIIKGNKSKRLRNKNSYMDEFLERRKQAADFALEKRNSSGYKYTKPCYYINNGNIILKNQNKKKLQNQIEDKKEFYKTYNTLKKNLTGKNNSINNIIFIEKENNKYYLSQGFPKNHNYNYSYYRTLNHQHCCQCCKYKNNFIDNQNNNLNGYSSKTYFREEGLNDDFLSTEDLAKNKLYKNIKHHSIDNSKNKKEKGQKNKKNNIIKNESISQTEMKNLKNGKNGKTNYNDKNKNQTAPLNNKNKNKEYFNPDKNQKDYNQNNNKYKSVQNTTTNLMSSIKIKETNKNKNVNSTGNIYYEGSDNHNFYDSNKMSYYKYNYETYKPISITQRNEEYQKYYSKNLSEPKTFGRNKNIYLIKANKNDLDFDENRKNQIGKNKLKDISPIRTYARYYYEDNNDDFQGIEKIYESQSIKGNGINDSNKVIKYNIKLNNNSNNKKYLDYKEKGIRTKSADSLHYHSTEIIKNTPNTKTISIIYKSEKNKANNQINKFNPEIDKKEIFNIRKDYNNNDKLKNEKNIIKIVPKDERIKSLDKNEENNNNINNKKYQEIIGNENLINKIKNNISENNDENKNIKENENIKNNNKIENNIKIENINDNEKKKDYKEEKNNINLKKGNKNDESKDKQINNIMDNDKEKNEENKKKVEEINNDISEDKKENKNEIKSLKNEKYNNNINNKESNNNINNLKYINNEDNINKNNENNEKYPEIVDHEQNYEIIKEKYESFLGQKDEKEPNFQSKIMNSMLTSKDDSNLINNKNNLIKNIKEKIKILKNNNKNNKENLNYSNEIDDYFTKIKEKEEKNNLVLNEFYQELLNKEKQANTEDNKNIKDFTKEIEEKNKDKKVIIQRSTRLQNMMKNILNNKKYKNYEFKNYNTIPLKTSFSKVQKSEGNEFREMTLKNNSNNIKLTKYNNTPNINLIVDDNFEENIKLFDEKEYTRLKNKNAKSSRPINLMNKKIIGFNQKYPSFRDRLDLFGFYNTNNKFIFNNKLNEKFTTSFSPKIIFQDSSNKIMPANEIY